MNKQKTNTPPTYIKCHLVLDAETDEMADARSQKLDVNRSQYVRRLIRADFIREQRREARREAVTA